MSLWCWHFMPVMVFDVFKSYRTFKAVLAVCSVGLLGLPGHVVVTQLGCLNAVLSLATHPAGYLCQALHQTILYIHPSGVLRYLPKASLSSCKSLLLLSRFLSTAASPWGAAPTALEQTRRKLRETPRFPSPCQKCTAKALK